MKDWGKLLSLIIGYVPFIVMLFLCAAYLIKQVNYLLDNSHPIIVSQIQDALGTKVDVGTATIRVPGKASVGKIVIYDPQNHSNVIATANDVIVEYSLLGLLRGNSASAVSKIIINKPYIVVTRFQNGRFSIQNLFKPKPPRKAPPFKGEIIFNNATADYIDQRADPLKPETIHLNKLYLYINYTKYPSYDFNVKFDGEIQKLSSVWLAGSYNVSTGQFKADTSIKGLSVRMGTKIAGIASRYRMKSGFANITAGVSIDDLIKGKKGKLRIANVVADMAGISGSTLR